MRIRSGHPALLRLWTATVALVVSIAAATGASGQDLASIEERLTRFELDNGMTFLVLQRREAPVVAFHIHANVGSVDESRGATGMAHLFEHMAFKGTTTVGVTDHEAEKPLLDRLDVLFLQIRDERRKGAAADEEKIARLQAEMAAVQEESEQYVVREELWRTFEKEGGVGLNAYTSWDKTGYILQLPANKIELWMALESDRFKNPVLREFYKEKDVVMEERRLRVENVPSGQLYEDFLAVAYKAHPYRTHVIGHMSDLENITREQAEAFFQEHYGPGNLTAAIVGDVDPDQVRQMAQTWFGAIPARPLPAPVVTVEPPQQGERRVTLERPAQPMLLMGFHRPDGAHPDDPVYNVIMEILGRGRTSRLHQSLVRDQQIAAMASAFTGFPGWRFPHLVVVAAVPAPGQTNAACEAAIEAELERLIQEPVSDEELQKARARSRADLVRQLVSNSGMADQLASYEALTGDWRNLFRDLDRIDQVTAEDVQRVARGVFVRANRTVGQVETALPADRPEATTQEGESE